MEQNISEREQLEEIKKWWDANGKAIVLGLGLGLCALFGYRYWQDTQNAHAESASINYDHFLDLASKGASTDALKAGATMLEAYPSSEYARLTALLLARLAVDEHKFEVAKRHLQWTIDHAQGTALASVAHARLAQILLVEGNATAALAEINKVAKPDAKELYAETRGDILVALGKRQEASAMYSKAIEALSASGGDPSTLELKRDATGADDPSTAAK